MKTDLLQSCGHCWVFQICWHIECSTFTASFFRIWNSSTGIPSPPLALFIVMLRKAHLTSHSRVSGSRWTATPSWLSRSLRPLLYSSSVFSCHLVFICSVSVRSKLFVLHCAHLRMKCSFEEFVREKVIFPSYSSAIFPSFSFLWNWNENWPFPVLWPLLSFPNLLAYWM